MYVFYYNMVPLIVIIQHEFELGENENLKTLTDEELFTSKNPRSLNWAQFLPLPGKKPIYIRRDHYKIEEVRAYIKTRYARVLKNKNKSKRSTK